MLSGSTTSRQRSRGRTSQGWPGGKTFQDNTLVVDPSRIRLTREDASLVFERMKREPLLFARHVLGVNLWSKQAEIFSDVFEKGRVAVRACHASGKSFCAACVVLAFVHLRFPCAVVTTAPTGRQVFTVIWREINKLVRRSKIPLGGKALAMSYTLFDDAYAIGVSTDDPDKLQGIHAPNILVVVDEATGLPDEMFDAIDSLLASGRASILLLGNPSRTDGYFYRVFNDPHFGKGWALHRISAFDTPNVQQRREVIPGLVTYEWVERRKEIWGEGHPLYQIRVLGEFPSRSHSNVVIPPDLIEQAKRNDLGDVSGPVILGVDVAEMGGDETVVAVRQGPYLLRTYAWSYEETTENIRRILDIVRRTGAKEVRVDKVGVGAAVYSFLKEALHDVHVVGVDVRSPTSHPDKYHDLRSEIWYEFRQKLRDGKVSFARYKDEEEDILYGQLTYPTFSPTPTGLIRVESKLEMRKRGLSSPDRAEAVLYAFWDADWLYVFTPPPPEFTESTTKEPVFLYSGIEFEEEEPPWRVERTNLREIL